MRSRDRTLSSNEDTWKFEDWRRSSCNAGFQFVQDLYTGTSGTVITQHTEDVITPGFGALRRDGFPLPMNPFIATTTSYTRTAGNVNIQNTGSPCSLRAYRGRYWESVQSRPSPPPIDDSIVGYVTNAAVSEAMRPKWDVATSLAEIRSTHRMIQSRAMAIMDFATGIAQRVLEERHPRSLRAAKFDKYWLEARYGWMPLILDAQDAMKAFGDKTAKGDRVNGSSLQSTTYADTNSIVHHFSNSDRTSVMSYTCNRKYRGWALAQVESPFNGRFGLDPLVTGWELIPFSFVIDWFIQIGDFLEATRPIGGKQRLISSGYSVRTTEIYREDVNYVYHSTAEGSITSISTEVRIDSYMRYPKGVSVPGWNPRLSELRLTDLAALLTRRMGVLAKLLMR